MARRHVSALLLGATLGLARPAPSLAEPGDAILRKCLIQVQGLERVREACRFFLANPMPYLHAGPTGDQVLEGDSWGTPKSRYLSAFIADPDDLRHKAGRVHLRHLDRRLDAWVDREDVVTPSELRRVTGCWPIRTMDVAAGDWVAGTLRLRRDGSGTLELDGKTLPLHVWFWKGAFVIRSERRDARPVAFGTIDLSARTAEMAESDERVGGLFGGGSELEGGTFEWDMGPGCEGGPVVR